MDVVPVGYRFVPIAKEIIEDYLINIDQDMPLPSRAVVKKEIYGGPSSSLAPWEVIGMDDPAWMPVVSDDDTNKRVIYVSTEIKYLNDKTKNHVNRRCGRGTWEGKSKPKRITNKNNELIGFKKSFTYKPDKDVRDDDDLKSKYGKWMMHEYSLAGVYKPKSNYVVCKITIDHQYQEDEQIINHDHHPNKKLKVGNDYYVHSNMISQQQQQEEEEEEGYINWMMPAPPPPTLIKHGFDDQFMMIPLTILAETSNPNPCTSSALAVDSFEELVSSSSSSTTSPKNQLQQINNMSSMPELDDLRPKVDINNGTRWEPIDHFEEENGQLDAVDINYHSVPVSNNEDNLPPDLGTMMMPAPPSCALSKADESSSSMYGVPVVVAASTMSPTQFEQEENHTMMMMLEYDINVGNDTSIGGTGAPSTCGGLIAEQFEDEYYELDQRVVPAYRTTSGYAGIKYNLDPESSEFMKNILHLPANYEQMLVGNDDGDGYTEIGDLWS